jgi:hypothetical protein
MTRTAPPPPNRGSFYTVVCGGTWLDRDKYAQAVVDYKGEDLRHTDVTDALHFNNFRKSEVASLAQQAYLQQAANILPKPILPPLFSGFEPLAQGVVGFFSKLLTPQPLLAERANALDMQMPTAKREGLLAQMFAALFGNKRDFQQLKVSKEEQEQRNASDFELAMPDLFSLGKLQEAQGRSDMGGEGRSGS